MESGDKMYKCVGCGQETQAYYDPSIGWYCGLCRIKWEKEWKDKY